MPTVGRAAHVIWQGNWNYSWFSLSMKVLLCVYWSSVHVIFQVQSLSQHPVSEINYMKEALDDGSWCGTVVVLEQPCFLPQPDVVFRCTSAELRPRKYKCGLSAPCPPKHLAFRLVSGAANVIGPKICVEDMMSDDLALLPLLSYLYLVFFF